MEIFYCSTGKSVYNINVRCYKRNSPGKQKCLKPLVFWLETLCNTEKCRRGDLARFDTPHRPNRLYSSFHAHATPPALPADSKTDSVGEFKKWGKILLKHSIFPFRWGISTIVRT